MVTSNCLNCLLLLWEETGKRSYTLPVLLHNRAKYNAFDLGVYNSALQHRKRFAAHFPWVRTAVNSVALPSWRRS